MKFKILWPLLYIVTWVMVYFLPRRFFHLGGAQPETSLLLALFFVILPALLYLTLNSYKVPHDRAKGWAILSVFLAMPFMLFLVDSEDQQELRENRQQTFGVVKEAWMVKSKWSVQVGYTVHGNYYQTGTLRNPPHSLTVGDTVTVYYSSKTPEICKIPELEQLPMKVFKFNE